MTPAFVSPVATSWRISAGFGDWGTYWAWNRQTSGVHAGQGQHAGTDFAVPNGTAVCSIAAGVVKDVSTSALSGLAVLVDHGAGWTSTYSHLSKALVAMGQAVAQGEIIALSGQSGTSATGPHLHLGVRDWTAPGGPWVDPRPFAPAAPVVPPPPSGPTATPAPGGFFVSGPGVTAPVILAGLAIVFAIASLGKKD